MMPIVPTALVRITRFYLLTALGYLVLTLALALVAAAGGSLLLTPTDASLFWYAGVLGWVALPVMGAFYQFFPTLQGQGLRLERWAFPQYALINLGLLGMLASVWLAHKGALGAFLLAFILLGRNLSPSKMTLTLRFYVAALVYFLAGVTLLALANLGLVPVGRSVVSHLVLIGWGVMAIFGAQYIMVPMLQLKTLAWEPLAEGQFYVANLGVLGLAWGFLGGGTPVIAAGGALETLAIALFVAVILRTLTTGPSRLARLDLSVKFYLAGDGYLVLVALLGIAMALFSWNLRTVHLHLGLIGVLTNTIIGAMYHILPFLVWWETYAGKVGLERVPLLKELFHEPFARLSFYLWNGSLWGLVAGFALGLYYLVALAGAAMVVLAILLLAQMVHLVFRQGGQDVPQAPQGTALNLTASGGA